jgi:hypothetical protein
VLNIRRWPRRLPQRTTNKLDFRSPIAEGFDLKARSHPSAWPFLHLSHSHLGCWGKRTSCPLSKALQLAGKMASASQDGSPCPVVAQFAFANIKHKARQQPATKGVRNSMRILIMIVTVLASALTLSACAGKKETMSTGTTASSVRTYSK